MIVDRGADSDVAVERVLDQGGGDLWICHDCRLRAAAARAGDQSWWTEHPQSMATHLLTHQHYGDRVPARLVAAVDAACRALNPHAGHALQHVGLFASWGDFGAWLLSALLVCVIIGGGFYAVLHLVGIL